MWLVTVGVLVCCLEYLFVSDDAILNDGFVLYEVYCVVCEIQKHSFVSLCTKVCFL